MVQSRGIIHEHRNSLLLLLLPFESLIASFPVFFTQISMNSNGQLRQPTQHNGLLKRPWGIGSLSVCVCVCLVVCFLQNDTERQKPREKTYFPGHVSVCVCVCVHVGMWFCD